MSPKKRKKRNSLSSQLLFPLRNCGRCLRLPTLPFTLKDERSHWYMPLILCVVFSLEPSGPKFLNFLVSLLPIAWRLSTACSENIPKESHCSIKAGAWKTSRCCFGIGTNLVQFCVVYSCSSRMEWHTRSNSDMSSSSSLSSLPSSSSSDMVSSSLASLSPFPASHSISESSLVCPSTSSEIGSSLETAGPP